MPEEDRSSGIVVTFGEALAVLLPGEPRPLEEVDELRLHVGGAEVNFAVGVSRLGLQAAFVGHVGDDAFGRLVRATLRREGVLTDYLALSPYPTGLYVREWLADGVRRPYYYRAGSAAAHFGPSDWPDTIVGARWLHVTGITPALSEGCRQATRRACEWAKAHQVPVSFDVNYRPSLWDAATAADTLRPFAEEADLLLIGHEEAQLLFGTDDPERLASLVDRRVELPDRTLVVKSGSDGATVWHRGELHHQPALAADARDPVGAGDAFDAAFVASRLAGRPVEDGLALAAHCAAKVVEQPGEHAGFPRLSLG